MYSPTALTVWVAKHVADQIAAEAATRSPLETGGVLLGYHAAAGGDIVVTHLVGSGGKGARHSAEAFSPDHAGQDKEIDRLFAETGGAAVYLGDWHSHPEGAATPSDKDRAVLRRIVDHPDAGLSRSLMIIVTPKQGEIAAWIGTKRWFRLHVRPAHIRLFRTPQGSPSA